MRWFHTTTTYIRSFSTQPAASSRIILRGREAGSTVLSLGSIRPYLVAARKWFSEADSGPGAEAGAEAGAGFGG